MKILVTGVAGFIGFHVAKVLLERGEDITGIDNLNSYYDVYLKESRLQQLRAFPNFRFARMDIAKGEELRRIFDADPPVQVIHLAAQAGVRYALDHPEAYVSSNLDGFVNMLEACRHADIEHLVYASSSSVYGANTKIPFSEADRVDQPVSLYGATKRANELMAAAYSGSFGMAMTGLRFFTVYGPWGRPDMSYFKFTANILKGEPLDVYNNGRHARDFTYIDDIINGVIGALEHPPLSGTGGQSSGMTTRHRLYNLGNNKPVELMYVIAVLEQLLGKKAVTRMLPRQLGDVDTTWADIGAAQSDLGYCPAVSIEHGLKQFIDWFMSYYGYLK